MFGIARSPDSTGRLQCDANDPSLREHSSRRKSSSSKRPKIREEKNGKAPHGCCPHVVGDADQIGLIGGQRTSVRRSAESRG
jgi:hypothetical protein